MSDEHDTLREEIEALKTSAVGQEHRLLQVLQNGYEAVRRGSHWPHFRRFEAVAAVVRYFFVGRPIIFVGLGLGGLLALHASFMLADQNRKLDLQNYLTTVSSELAEAQRNSQFIQLIAPLIDSVRSETGKATAKFAENRAGKDVVALEPGLAIRISVLTQTFQPYRWIQSDVEAQDLLRTQGQGAFYRFLTALRTVYESGFGDHRMAQELMKSRIPALTVERLSPERGLLLVNLHALDVDLRQLTQWNTTFQASYAPGARLDVDLTRFGGQV